MTGCEADACDLLQETYYRAFTRMDRYDGRAALSTWLYRIAINEALASRRRQRRRAVIHDDWLQSPGRAICGDSDDPAPIVNDRLDVEEALAALPESDRVLLLLRYQEGFDYRLIAEITGRAEGTVASRLNRARAKLRRLLDASGQAEAALSAAHLTSG
jgi:RNA polymerase sigma-70 factor (ECF subfamily)